MARPTKPNFNPPQNNAEMFGRRARDTLSLLDNVVDYMDESSLYQSGLKLVPALDNSFTTDEQTFSVEGNSPYHYNSATGKLQRGRTSLFREQNAVSFETRPSYPITTGTASTNSISSFFGTTGTFTTSNIKGYNSINLGTGTLTYPNMDDDLEMNLYAAVRVPSTSSMFITIKDGTSDWTGIRILQQSTPSGNILSGAFVSGIGSFNTSSSSPILGGGIYFLRLNIPARTNTATSFRQFNITWEKFGVDDYATAFAPENNYNFTNGIEVTSAGSVLIQSSARREISFTGATTGAQLFHARLEVGNPRNAL